MKTEFPRIERAQYGIELAHTYKGRPHYRWVQGWIVRYSLHRVSTAMRYREALELLREEKAKACAHSV